MNCRTLHNPSKIIVILLFTIRCSFLFSQIPQIPDFVVSATSVCVNSEISFTNTSAPGVFKDFEWDFDGNGTDLPGTEGGTVTHTYGQYYKGIVTLKAKKISDGLEAFGGQSITVSAPNSASILPPPSLVCKGMVNLTNSSTVNDEGITHISIWDFGDGSPVLQTNLLKVDHEFLIDGNITITLTDSNSCGTSVTEAQINVNLLNTQIVCSSADTVCQGESALFSNSNDYPGMTYIWDFGDGSAVSNAVSPVHRFVSTGDFTVSLQVEIPGGFGCSDNSTMDVNILPGPIAEFLFIPPSKCDTADITFIDKSQQTLPSDSYLWEFGNGETANSSALNGSIRFNSAGYYYPTLTITRNSNLCVSTYTDTLLIPQTPSANFTANNVCIGFPAGFTDATPVTIPALTEFAWDFGDGATETVQNPSHTYGVFGEKDVKLTVTNGFCSDEMTIVVTVEDLPHPAFDLSSFKGCSELEITTVNQTPDGKNYRWDFGDFSFLTARDTSYTFSNTSMSDTIIEVKLIASTAFGCSDSISKSVTVLHTPVAAILSDAKPLPVCVPDTVRFNSSTKGADLLKWDFGDNTSSSDSSVLHIFKNDEHYFRYFMVNLIAESENGCTDTATQYVTLYPKPNTDFIMDTVSSKCGSTTIEFSAPAEFNGLYTWIFSPGDTLVTTDLHPDHIFTNTGTVPVDYPVELISRNQFGCLGDTTINLSVPPMPPPADLQFSIDPVSGCPPLTVNITDFSENTDTATYIWDFDDGSYSYEQNPVHTYFDGGEKTVSLVATGLDCIENEKDTVVTVFDIPNAGFDISPEAPMVPDDPVLFVPVYKYENWDYKWSLGDGATSDSMEVIHYYKDTTSYRVTLVVITENGCTDTVSKIIKGRISGRIKASNVLFPLKGMGGRYADGIGDAGEGDDVFTPVTEGVTEYHLEIYDRWGEQLFSQDSEVPDHVVGWTGYYRGSLCREDVYVWKASGRYANGKAFVKAGTITLIYQDGQ
jgi:PKD repeat protein